MKKMTHQQSAYTSTATGRGRTAHRNPFVAKTKSNWGTSDWTLNAPVRYLDDICLFEFEPDISPILNQPRISDNVQQLILRNYDKSIESITNFIDDLLEQITVTLGADEIDVGALQILGNAGARVLKDAISEIKKAANDGSWPLSSININIASDPDADVSSYIVATLKLDTNFENGEEFLNYLYPILQRFADNLSVRSRSVFMDMIYFDVETT